MDDQATGGESGTGQELEPRAPLQEDLVALCRRLNELGAKYVVVGGFAIIYSGYARTTTAIDLLVATDLENEALVYRGLEVLPDKAVLELIQAKWPSMPWSGWPTRWWST